jgi:hypothetical protein
MKMKRMSGRVRKNAQMCTMVFLCLLNNDQ